MYLRKLKKNGRIHLSVVMGYRNKNGKPTSKTIKTFGYADQYKDQYEDPIAHFKEVAKQMDAEVREENAPKIMKFYPKQKIDKRECNQVELGTAVISKYFHKDLGIWRFFEKKRTARKFRADPCRILELLVCDRIMHPSSKKKAWENKDKFPRKCNFSLDELYRSLSYIANNKELLIEHMNTTFKNTRSTRKTKVLYYDVTNYYFEIENEDDFRRRGVSKEHRPNPIIQMGLLLDQKGLPLNYELFSGNTNDNLTLLPIMKQTGLRKSPEKIIIVADKGINCSDNIAACILDKNGYIFSQSVRKANKELKSWILNEKDYSVNDTNTFKIKSRQSYKNVYVAGQDGKRKCVKVPVKEVAFWSKDFEDRSRYERLKVIEKSQNALSNNLIGANNAHSSTKYVKDIPINKQTGEMASHYWVLDKEKISNDEKYDGYYCIVTSETDMDDHEIIDSYRGLWKIEESFKITKSDFNARPIRVSTKDHIQAHFLICYISLFIMRLIQLDTKNKYSSTEIAYTLRNIVGHRLDTNLYFFDFRNDLTDLFTKFYGIDLNLQTLTRKQIAQIMSKVKNC